MNPGKQQRHLRLGTRGSPLALWQARWVAAALHAQHPDVTTEIVVITTTGDKNRRDPLSQIGSKGLFVREIETALLEHQIDLAVHSMKDMPTTLPPGLHFGAIPPRGEARDAYVGHDGRRLAEIAGPWRIGTGSRRRQAQLLATYKSFQVQDMRGNVDTRLRKMRQGEVHGLVLAAAGLIRLERQQDITEFLPFEVMLPAPGQGALAVETRRDDWLEALLVPLHDPLTASAVTAERAFLAALGGGCMLPVAALAQCQGERLCLSGFVGTPDGRYQMRQELWGSIHDAARVGEQLAEQFRANGADALLAMVDLR
jgi:hydroxymethylbilane synthase